MASSKMFGVSSGSYSDYSVLCLCPTEADAKAIVKKLSASERYPDFQVESWPIIDGTVQKTEVLYLSTTLWDDGTETHTSERSESVWPFGYDRVAAVEWRWVRAPMHKDKGGRLDVKGTDLKRVRKVYSDKRAELIAVDAARMREELEGRRQ